MTMTATVRIKRARIAITKATLSGKTVTNHRTKNEVFH